MPFLQNIWKTLFIIWKTIIFSFTCALSPCVHAFLRKILWFRTYYYHCCCCYFCKSTSMSGFVRKFYFFFLSTWKPFMINATLSHLLPTLIGIGPNLRGKGNDDLAQLKFCMHVVPISSMQMLGMVEVSLTRESTQGFVRVICRAYSNQKRVDVWKIKVKISSTFSTYIPHSSPFW